METKTLLVRDVDGIFKVAVPADAKVTFGPVTPKEHSEVDGGRCGRSNLCLRIYQSDEKQLAAFTRVIAFRDMSLKVERLVIKEEGTKTWTQDEDGFTSAISVKQSKKFVGDEE